MSRTHCGDVISAGEAAFIKLLVSKMNSTGTQYYFLIFLQRLPVLFRLNGLLSLHLFLGRLKLLLPVGFH
jgi:hypothetical protein